MIRLEVIDGHSPGTVFELAGTVCVIGRADDSHVVLQDAHVSGRHAQVVFGLHDAVLEDLGSTNGTALIRGKERTELSGCGEAVPLRDGDIVELGRDGDICRLRVEVREADTSAHVAVVKRIDDADPSAFRDDPVTMRALYDAQSRIGRATELDRVLDTIATAVFDLVALSTHVTVVLEVADAVAVTPTAKRGRRKVRNYLPVLTRARPNEGDAENEAAHVFVPVTRSVYRKVLDERSAVLAADAPKDVGASPSIMGASVRSTIAVPLWRSDEILGVLQVDNRDAPGMLKPKDLDVLLVVAEHASLAVANARLIKRLRVAEEKLRHENRFLRNREQARRAGGGGARSGAQIIGASAPMAALQKQIDQVADTGVTVLVEGETGTGKELIASALHELSGRRDKLFVAQNCAALAESLLESELFGHKKGAFTGATEDKKGLFELADGSTLFLDEITEAPMTIQSKLLRALQEGEIRALGSSEGRRVNVRVVAATNRKLDDEVASGRFREDLYYRLKVFPVRVPPLRERRGDIPLLMHHFLERYASEIGRPVAGVSSETEDLLVAYDWPGNVRELQNEAQRLVIQVEPGAFVTPELLSPQMRHGEQLVARAGGKRGKLRATMAAVEKFVILEALRAHDGNKTTTAKSLGITREGLHKKLRTFSS